MVFTETEIAYLSSQRLGRLAAVQPNGTLQVSPVGFSYNPDTSTIDINGFNLAKSQKFRNIADNGRAPATATSTRAGASPHGDRRVWRSRGSAVPLSRWRS